MKWTTLEAVGNQCLYQSISHIRLLCKTQCASVSLGCERCGLRERCCHMGSTGLINAENQTVITRKHVIDGDEDDGRRRLLSMRRHTYTVSTAGSQGWVGVLRGSGPASLARRRAPDLNRSRAEPTRRRPQPWRFSWDCA